MIKHSDYLKQKEGFISQYESMTREMSDFYMEVFLAQEESAPKFKDLLKDKKFFQHDKSPVIVVEDISIRDELLNEFLDLLKKITAIISKRNQGMNFSLLLDNFSDDADFIFSKMLKLDFAELENKCVKYNMAIDEFIFVMHNLFKPMLVELRKLSEIDFTNDEYFGADCPFCGYLPSMGKIIEAKENKRYLHCSMCENIWNFPRLACPNCDCTDQAKLGYFEFEDNSRYRVYYCDDCKCYIKSVKTQKLEETEYDLTVEDIITNFIDATMIDKGYKRI